MLNTMKSMLFITIFTFFFVGQGIAPNGNLYFGKIKLDVKSAEAQSKYKKKSRSSSSRSSNRRKASPSTAPKMRSSTQRKKSSAKISSTRYKKAAYRPEMRKSSGSKGVWNRKPTRRISGNSTSTKVMSRKVSAKVNAVSARDKRFARQKPPLRASSVRASRQYKNIKPVTRKVYRQRRNSFYSAWNEPTWVTRSYSRFGVYDAAFLWFMLDRSAHDRSYARMYYSRVNEPGFREWRNEADRMAAENSELRAQLATLDQETNRFQGQPQDPNFVPKGADASLVMAAELVLTAATGKLTVGTGSKEGTYYEFCTELAKNVKNIDIECVSTSGSSENLKGMETGRFGAVLTQSDALQDFPNVEAVSDASLLYPEVVFLIAHRNSSIGSIDDIDPNKHSIFFLGSGSEVTINGFARLESDYSLIANSGKLVKPNQASIRAIANLNNSAGFYVCSLNCGLLRLANNSYPNLLLGKISDGDLDQSGFYTEVEIPGETYKNLLSGSWWGTNPAESIAVNALFLIAHDWAENEGIEAMGRLEDGMWPAMTMIQKKAGVPEY